MKNEESTIDAPVNANAAQDYAEINAKHKKSSRYFPSAEDIEKGDRFNILKGTGIHSATLNTSIALNEDIRVEILGRANDDSEESYIDFSCVKLERMGDGTWKHDPKFGMLTVNYTDLSAWAYKPKK